ncbi:hypothetical protein D3C80_2010540 [compost metagenome]
MSEQPCDSDCCVGYFFFSGQFADNFIELRELLIAQEYAFKEAVLERGPRLNRHIMQAAVLQNAPVMYN